MKTKCVTKQPGFGLSSRTSVMKKLTSGAFLLVLLSVASQGASAQIIIGNALSGLVTQLPGSATDYVLFNAASPTVTTLPDFSVTTHGNPLYEYSDPNGSPTNTSIITPGPLGTSVSTGAVWQYSSGQVISFTLSNPTFDYSNFNVYALYGNVNYNDASLNNNFNTSFSFDNDSIGLGTGSSDFGGTFVTVTDTNTSATEGQIVEFNITGATEGQTFTFGAVSATPSDEIDFGGISFASPQSTPEPSTWAMMLAGLVTLVGVQRFARKA
jgi:hypothetical protein